MQATILNLTSSPIRMPPSLGNVLLPANADAPNGVDFTYSKLTGNDRNRLVDLADDGKISFPGNPGAGILAGLPVTPSLTYVLNGQEPDGQPIGSTVISISDDLQKRTLKSELALNGDPNGIDVWVTDGNDYFDTIGTVPGRIAGKNFIWRGKKILCLGGNDLTNSSDGSLPGNCSVDIYDMNTKVTTRSSSVPMMGGLPGQTDNGSWVAQVNDDQFVVFPVFNDADLGTFIYDAKADTWTRAGNCLASQSLFGGHQSQQAIVLKDGRVLVYGNGGFTTGDPYGNDYNGVPGFPPGNHVSAVFTPGPKNHPEQGSWAYTGNGASTTLNGALNGTATTITVASTNGFPSSGSIVVTPTTASAANSFARDEVVNYTGKTSTTFTGCTRSAEGTGGAQLTHLDGAAVKHISLVPATTCANPVMCILKDGRVVYVASLGRDGTFAFFNDPAVIQASQGFQQFGAMSALTKHAAIFDPKTNSWALLPDMPFIPEEDGLLPAGVESGGRNFAGLAALNDGRMIVVGGDMGCNDTLPGASTTLSADLNNSDTTIHVASTTGFPNAGRLVIDEENIEYTGKTSNTFTGCTRAIRSWWHLYGNPAAAVAHTNGTAVLRVRCYNKLVTDPSVANSLSDTGFRQSCLIFDPDLYDNNQNPWIRIQDAPFYGNEYSEVITVDSDHVVVLAKSGNYVEADLSGTIWNLAAPPTSIAGMPNAQIYNIKTNTWSVGASMPLVDLGSNGIYLYFSTGFQNAGANPVLTSKNELITLATFNTNDFSNDQGYKYVIGNATHENKKGRHCSAKPPKICKDDKDRRHGKINPHSYKKPR